MRAGPMIATATLVLAAAWWLAGHPGYETTEQRLARVAKEEEAAKPKLYRWRDDNGVLHISDQPPKGRKYEQVELREEQNIVPMSGPAPEPPN
jgi:hypothetical protein